MSITFYPEPTPESGRILGHHLACPAQPHQDRRRFTSHEQASAGLVDHHQHCRHELCGPDQPSEAYIVTEHAGDDEPELNVSTSNAALLLRALGFAPELGADDVHVRPLDADHDPIEAAVDVDMAPYP